MNFSKSAYIVLFFCFCILTSINYAEKPLSDKARGMFICIAVGPRTPIGSFGTNSMTGIGFNAELDYTDNEYLPIFLFAKVEFLHFPGAQEFYQSGDYSHLSTNILPLSMGGRYYFAPILENVGLVLPYIEIAGHIAAYQKLHQFKISTYLPSYIESGTKFGVSAGVGFSMFILEMLASYTYFKSNQFVGVDLKVRLPMYVSI